MSTVLPSESPSVDSSAQAPQRRSLVRRAAATLMAEGPGGLARMAKHGVGWRYRRVVMASRANNGLLGRLTGDHPSSGGSGTMSGATPVQAKVGSTSGAVPVQAKVESTSGAVLVQAKVGSISGATPVQAKVSMAAAEAVLQSLRVPTSPAASLPANPTIGVVIPTYRDSAFLAAALQSVCEQTYPYWRCVVIDDAAPEDVGAIVKPFLLADSRIQLLRHGANGGLPAARNTGLRHLDTDMVMFLDADDLLVPTALDHAVRCFAQHWSDAAVAGVHGQIIQVPEEVDLRDLATWSGTYHRPVVDWAGYTGQCPFNVHAVVVRRALVDACGGFDETLRGGAEDWDMWFRLLRHGYRFEPNEHLVGAYRQRRASMIRNHHDIHIGRAARLFAAAESWALLDPELKVGRGAAAPLSRSRLAIERARRVSTVVGMQIAASGSLDPLVDSDAYALLDLAALPEGRWSELVESGRNGVARGLGLSRGIAEDLSPLAHDRVQRIARAVADEICWRPPVGADVAVGFDATSRHSPVDVLLVAESTADVRALAPVVARRVGQVRIAALDLELVSGASGANAAWASAGIDVVPYHQVVSTLASIVQVVACAPVGPVAADLLGEAEQAGAQCVVLRVPGRPETLLCSAGARFEAAAQSPDAVADAVAGTSAGDRSNVRRSSHRQWRGSDFPARLHLEDGPLHPPSIERLLSLRDRHRGETAVIIGNGPSLNETELEILTDVPTFGVNAIFLGAERLPKPVTYYVVEDTSVFRENLEAIKAFEAEWKLFPAMYLDSFDEEEIGEQTVFFRMNAGFYDRKSGTACHPRFSLDATQRLYCGQSVTILNLQLAHWMGFHRVVLIGMDFTYTIPDDVDRDGALIISRTDDPNHFHPDYFGSGKSWKDPMLDRVLVNYHLADEIYRATGREIVNATEGGKLDVFPRLPLRDAIGVAPDR
jgi:GT2 family glycosyltransferase